MKTLRGRGGRKRKGRKKRNRKREDRRGGGDLKRVPGEGEY